MRCYSHVILRGLHGTCEHGDHTLTVCTMQAKELTTAAVKRLSEFNRRTLDALAARIYFYYSWSYECCNSLSEIRR